MKLRPKAVRPWRPFIKIVEQLHVALQGDFSRCTCTLDAAGRYQNAPTKCTAPAKSCRTVTHVAVRTMLIQLRLPERHLNAAQLEAAIDGLYRFTRDLPRLDDEAAKERIVEAVEMRRYEREAGR